MKFPLKFEISAQASSGVEDLWTAQTAHLQPITSAIPPEFMGPGGGYSPEDLFAIALLNCLIATYKVYCKKGGISFKTIQGKAILTIDHIPGEGPFGMKAIDVTLHVEGASDPNKARQILETAIKDCAVSNSIKSGKTFHLNVS